jgi:hypothetical protein
MMEHGLIVDTLKDHTEKEYTGGERCWLEMKRSVRNPVKSLGGDGHDSC